MGGNLTYENLALREQKQSIKSPEEKLIMQAGKFPNCKGLYPDCPEKPDKNDKMCRTCPVLDKED
ncbi:MAG: hypothetical protein AB1467_06990 [Candidatus Diapherotrites archaeon]